MLYIPFIAPKVLAALLGPSSKTFFASLASLLKTILRHLDYQDAGIQSSYEPIMNLFALLIDHRSLSTETKIPLQGNYPTQSLPFSWCIWLAENGLYQSLRAHLLRMVSAIVIMCTESDVVLINTISCSDLKRRT
jgi:hypothetical protein